ncbi:flagellar hook-length control protein FliK [Variovorax sp. AB1(2024)]|uniref:flagellar hook-length control protein FliK n=1 Tax=Variovorax sp. AB1(2024) TaxID=3132214 RepID=UPI0030B34957
MSALAGLVDALLAARLTPRLDVLGIKPETTIGAPGPAIAVGKVANDVRLPSNAALDRQIPAGSPGGAAHASSGAGPSAATQLSLAARVIGAVLADLQAEPGPVRGAAPLSAARQPATAQALAGTLAQTVSNSGLFYESHLAEFAAGGRSLAQMAQEPQAKWSVPLAAAAARPAAAAAAAVAQAVLADMPEMAPATAAAAGAPAAAAAQAPAAVPGALVPNAPATAAATADAKPNPDGSAPSGMPGESDASGAADAAPSADAARVQAAYRQPGAATADAMQAHRASQAEAARQSDSQAAPPASRSANSAEVIHPQAVALVHQQLDLLASANFRWSGQAWPDVPMSWSIEEEQRQPDARGGADPQDEATRRWSTTVSLVLPRLGEVDLRLSLTGASVQAYLSAREADTMARLRDDAGRLTQRFEAAGLQLQQLQVTAKAHA